MPSKRAKKKVAAKRAKKNTGSRQTERARRKNGGPKKLLFAAGVLTVVVSLGLLAVYLFGSIEIRERYHQAGMKATNIARSIDGLPSFARRPIEALHDRIPGSEGFSVDSGELGREESHFIAGQPRSIHPVQLLRNKSYFNLFSPAHKQSVCIATRLTRTTAGGTSSESSFVKDPRIQNLDSSAMEMGEWSATPLLSSLVLDRQEGDIASKEANLATNLVPMTKAFANEIWHSVLNEFAIRYPDRFDEVWLYLGPVYNQQVAKLSSGVTIPDAFYIIVFDLTDAGGLRALALLIPTDATSKRLSDYITSISKIEERIGLQFIPAAEAYIDEILGTWNNPHLW